MKLVLVGCCAIAAVTLNAPPVSAGQPGGGNVNTNAPTDGPRTADPSRRVCRSIRPTGSRLATRVCRTQAAWDELREETRRYVEDGQNNGSRPNEGIGPGI